MSPLRGSLVSWLLVASALLASGCISVRIEMGRPVDPGLLEAKLRIGESTRADVLSILGEPGGQGRGLLPIDSAPKTVWLYYYAEASVESSELEDIRQLLLWVYLDGDRYDGYLWFSSLPRMSAWLAEGGGP